MTSVVLHVTPYQTSLECKWDIYDISTNQLTSAVLNYTDISNNAWYSINISNTDKFTQSTTISNLGSSTAYRVFLTTRYIRPDKTSFTVVSNVVVSNTDKKPDQPHITLLAGKDFIQVLFTDPNGAAYNFVANEVVSVIVFYNKLQSNHVATSDVSIASEGGVISYSAEDIKIYTFSNPDAETTTTYHYLLLTDLETDADYEVAATYYKLDTLGAGPVSETQTITTMANDVDISNNDPGVTNKFMSYALNDVSMNEVNGMSALGVNPPKINVRWLDPLVVSTDIFADIPTIPNYIVREEWYDPSGTWFNRDPNWVLLFDPSSSIIDLSGNPHYSKTDAIYTYVDTNLVAGHKYRYTIYATFMYSETSFVNTTSTTNEVVAVKETVLDLDNNDFVLDPSNGSIWLQSDFSEIIKDTGGFPQDASGVYQLEYKFVDASAAIIPIFTTPSNELMTDPILRTNGQELLEYATIKLTPYMITTYRYEWIGVKEQIIYYENSADARNTNNLNYNTTFPLEVTNFAYENTIDVSTAASSFTLSWDDDDDTTNPNNDQYYRVIATDDSNDTFTIILSKSDISANVLADVSGNIYDDITSGSYIIDASTDISTNFFTTGSSYNFSIQRGYISTNTITNSSYTDLVVLAEGGTNNLLYGPISDPDVNLTMFNNPPAPTVSNYTFNEATDVLAFDMSYNISVSDDVTNYGFLQSDTLFRVTVSPAANNNYPFDAFSFDDISGNQLYTVDMSGVAVGASCVLTVEEYVTTDYNSLGDSTSFYSTDTSFDFVRKGPLAQPKNVITTNTDGLPGSPLGEEITVSWDIVSDTSATKLGAHIYYEVILTNNNDASIQTYDTVDASTVSHSFNVVYGGSYSATVRSYYQDNDFVVEVSSEKTAPTASIISFNNPPAPTVSNYTFNEATVVLAFDMSYNISVSDDVTNYGFLQSDTLFRVTVSPAANNNYPFDAFSFDDISGNQLYTVDMSGVAVGASCVLTVEEYVTTDYNSLGDSTSFYSTDTSFDFVREGSLAQPRYVISYNTDVNFIPLDNNMTVSWGIVPDNAATTLGAPIYYQIIVTDYGVESPNLFLLENSISMTSYFNQSVALSSVDILDGIIIDGTPAPIYSTSTPFFITDTSNAYTIFSSASDTLSITISNLHRGDAYSYKIRQVYYDSIFEKYVYSPYTSTNTSLISFILPPVPIVFMDIENANDDISGNDQLGVTIEYNSVNNCGFQNADISFAYMNNGIPDVWNTLDQGYNAISLNPFDISLGVAIPISLDTCLITLANSDAAQGTTFRSVSVNNVDSINEVLYIQDPQIKAIEVRYDTSNNCIITVLLDDNGGGITSVTAVAITTSNQVETIVDKTPNITPSGNSDNDDIYIFTISNVPPSGLDYISITVVGSGTRAIVDVATLPVEQTVLDDNGILAGSYIIETQVRNQ